MTIQKQTIRLAVSGLVISTHLLAFFTIMFLESDFASPTERTDAALLLLPITAAYVLAIGRRAISSQGDVDIGPVVNAEYILFVSLITSGFVAAMLLTVFSFPSRLIPTIETVKRFLLIIEIGIGAALGMIVEDLFGKVERITVPMDAKPTTD